ncbi:MAG: hypothetical protein HW412_1994 [Bacteroidetes bacterium]|nr:hypothetical protein [Bacteroidota bacterium]
MTNDHQVSDMNLHPISIRPTLVLLLLLTAPCFAAAPDSIRCYVWTFAMNTGERNNHTRYLTDEFEEQLTRRQFCRVLQRRDIARLIAQKDNERTVMNLEKISKASVDTLTAYDANTVVFGDVIDDVGSGEYRAKVTFQSFAHSIRVWSTSIPRGRINDATTRQQAMADLVKTIEDDLTATIRETKRKEYFPYISTLLQQYILRAKNLKDSFRLLPALVDRVPNVGKDLERAVLQYNQVFDSIKTHQEMLTTLVTDNWRNPELTKELQNLLRYALLDIHETEILVFNEMSAKIMSIHSGKITDAKEVELTEATIKATVPGRVETLSAKLVQLERMTSILLDDLRPQ